MISKKLIQEWYKNAPFQMLEMVEQDLIISRALVCIFSNETVRESVGFIGGTAINKAFLDNMRRFSEDIDLVQLRCEPIGVTLNAIRSTLDPWLGEPTWKKTQQSHKLIYRYQSANATPMRLKIEINTREHYYALNLLYKDYSLDSEWFSGQASITTFKFEELIAGKLTALYQRSKGRDLFDIDLVFSNNLINSELTIELFQKYCSHKKVRITRKQFIQNLKLKRLDADFRTDMNKLLPLGTSWNFEEGFEYVLNNVITLLP